MSLAPIALARLQASFAATIAAGMWWWLRHAPLAVVAVVAAVLALLAWFAPSLHAPMHRGILALVQQIVRALSWCLLGVVYFGILTPVRLVRSAARVDPLRLRRDRAARSFLTPIDERSARRFDRPF